MELRQRENSSNTRNEMQAQLVGLQHDLRRVKKAISMLTPKPGHKFAVAKDAESGKMYRISVGLSRTVNAEFLCFGRGKFFGVVFFRKSPHIYGIRDWEMIKEVERTWTEEHGG